MRSVNPLQPIYQIKDENGNLVDYGNIEGSSPKKTKERANFQLYSSMRVNDIQGTDVGSKTAGNFHSRSRKDWKNTNSLQDI